MTERVSNREGSKVMSLHDVIVKLNGWEHGDWDNGLRLSSGLVTMCGDILHRGHIDFLEEAKRHVDVLIVGVDRDETVALKGSGRPIFKLVDRCEMISKFACVTLVFPIPFVLNTYTQSSQNAALFEEMTKKLFWSTDLYEIMPYCIITNESADDFWEEKKIRAEKLQLKYLGLRLQRTTSTTEVVTKIKTL